MTRFLWAAPLALAACATTPSQVQTYAALIDAGVIAYTPVVLATNGITPSDAAAITRYSQAVQEAANAIAKASAADAKISVGTLVGAVRALEPIALRYLPAGSQNALAVEATVSLLPSILAASGVVLPMAGERAPAMTEAQAVGVLERVRK